MKLAFPRLYVILDAALARGSLVEVARSLAEAGVELIQYRDKTATADTLLGQSWELAAVLRPFGACLVVNDRADVAAMAGAAGVHVGQEDLSPEEARAICGLERWVGLSTHNIEQVRTAAAGSAEYIAVGPIFATKTKENPDPVVGLELIREARKLTRKPLVAVGGITEERCGEVFAAGADCVAVASDILGSKDPAGRARSYLG